MQIIRGLESYPPEGPPSAVALGVFDGVHLAHRAILAAAVTHARAAGACALACTFDPHPAEVLHPGQAPPAISTLEERLELIAASGMDGTVVVPFTLELAAMEPEAFVKDVLLDRLRARAVVVGFNHTFGRGARGTPALLRELAPRLGFTAHVVPPLDVDGVPVSSSAIREALRAGDVERAARYLGRPYALRGRVVPGAGRGHALGVPTANLEPDRTPLLAPGVYVTRVVLGPGETRGAVANVGVRPTFGGGRLVVETHLLDFRGDLYGRTLGVEFLSWLRPERTFDGVEALRAQIQDDIAEARRRLGTG
jgi:riboflavin kinase/FMN adenylyltransferase